MHPLVLAIVLYSSVAQISGQDSADVRFTHQILSVAGPSKEFPSECLPPLSVMIFLRKQICVHVCLAEKLAVANKLLEQQGLAEVSTLGVQRLTGFRYGQGSLHGQGMAIDIDAATNPYLIHERNESKLDADLAIVYERIAQFLLGRPSVVPRLGSERQTKETRHNYAARLYNLLAQESGAMQRYFALMQNGRQLQDYLRTPLGLRRVRLSNTFRSVLSRGDESSPQTPNVVSTSLSNLMIDQIRLGMMADWMILTGKVGPPILALAKADGVSKGENYLPYPQVAPPKSDDTAKGEADRPFDSKGKAYPGRSPLNGFLTLKKELVLALVDAGLRWGAVDFGRTSGDLMHFDSRETTCNGTSN